MSKHKKRVSLAQRPAEGGAPPVSPLTMPKETAASSASYQTEQQQPEIEPELVEEADEQDQNIENSQPGIESHPLFWFMLGALTVGIIVLIGLLMFTPPRAAPAARATAAATAPALRPVTPKPATAAPVAGQTPIPDIPATMTAVMERNQSVQRASLEETRTKLAAGSALVVDVRSQQTYAAKHIKGAVNIPELDTEARLAEFPKNKDIILYCS